MRHLQQMQPHEDMAVLSPQGRSDILDISSGANNISGYKTSASKKDDQRSQGETRTSEVAKKRKVTSQVIPRNIIQSAKV